MPDDFTDDEGQEFLGKLGVEIGFFRQTLQPPPPPPPPPPPLPDPNSPEGRVALAPGVEILPEDRVPDLPRPPSPGGDGAAPPPGPAGAPDDEPTPTDAPTDAPADPPADVAPEPAAASPFDLSTDAVSEPATALPFDRPVRSGRCRHRPSGWATGAYTGSCGATAGGGPVAS